MFMLACVSSLQWSDASFTGSYHRFTNKIWETRKTGGFGPQCSQETCIWLDNMIHIHKYSEYVCWHTDNTRDTRIQFKYKTSHYGIRSFAKCKTWVTKFSYTPPISADPVVSVRPRHGPTILSTLFVNTVNLNLPSCQKQRFTPTQTINNIVTLYREAFYSVRFHIAIICLILQLNAHWNLVEKLKVYML